MPKVLDPMKKNESILLIVGFLVLVGGIYGYALFTAPTATSKAKPVQTEVASKEQKNRRMGTKEA